jgi:hypothetical protein
MKNPRPVRGFFSPVSGRRVVPLQPSKLNETVNPEPLFLHPPNSRNPPPGNGLRALTRPAPN